MIVENFRLYGPGINLGPSFGVWKQPTGRKRCQAVSRLTSRFGKKCFRQEGHDGNHGWDLFPGQVKPA